MSKQHTFGWRDLLGAVNLRDFAHMVAGELALIGASTRLAFESLPRLPFGPIIFLGALLMVLFRLVLLVLVVIAFGTAILVIWAVRGAARVLRGRGGS